MALSVVILCATCTFTLSELGTGGAHARLGEAAATGPPVQHADRVHQPVSAQGQTIRADSKLSLTDDLEFDTIMDKATGLKPASVLGPDSSANNVAHHAAGPGAAGRSSCPVEAISCDPHVMQIGVLCAELSALVYKDKEVLRSGAQFGPFGVSSDDSLETAEGQCCLFTARLFHHQLAPGSTPEHQFAMFNVPQVGIVAAFRGTDRPCDWRSNLSCKPMDLHNASREFKVCKTNTHV